MTREPLDLRLAPAAIATWLIAAWGLSWPLTRAAGGAILLVALGVASARVAARLRGAHRRPTAPHTAVRIFATRAVAATLIVSAAALAASAMHSGATRSGPVAHLARERAEVDVVARVATDPVRRDGQFEPYTLVRLNVREVEGRGVISDVRSPVLVVADLSWLDVQLGDTIEASGRLAPAESDDLAAVLQGRSNPLVVKPAPWYLRGVGTIRNGIVEAAAPLGPAESALVPALVDGDDSSMPDDVTADFQTTGLTHLLAVSGSNLTLVVSFALTVARWCRVRGRWLSVVGLACVAFFVLLARPEPSVLRAAAMGLVALAGLAVGGRQRGVRSLCVAVVGLVLLDPWLARSAGFLLSTLATAGILLFGTGWRDAMARWMPAMLAEAIAVPLAAQVVCTPAIAAISGSISLVAVATNLAAAPAVGPATVLGLIGGFAALVGDGLGHLLGRVAGLPAWWIITVARRGAALHGASVGWPVGPIALAALTAVCAVVVLLIPLALERRAVTLAIGALLAIVVVHPIGRLGWPPSDWLMVVCDVGQGDGLVLNAGNGQAVVVDTGPDPALIDACLDKLKVKAVPLVVLTHFHADHADGLSGVLDGRKVGEIEVSPYAEPADRAATVHRLASDNGIPVVTAQAGEQRTVGDLSWAVLGPTELPTDGDEGSAPNNASVVMRVEVDGHTLLLTGDAEPQEQDDVLDAGTDLATEVLKVPHHGSANTDPGFVDAADPLIAVISVGADNDYGHPSPTALAMLDAIGAHVYRTDQDGDIAIVDKLGQLAVVTSS